MAVYFNEIDPFAAQWLRNLINAGLIPAGDVDQRSIVDVEQDDLKGYTQCHFFAGIAGWSEALRLAGWPEDRPVWTGSCPCQPFSVSGKREGHLDERHLWPAFYRLIAERRPPTIFGEQVAGKDGREWLAGVRLDLEAAGYACGAADLCAAGVGSPHIRQRLYWVAYATGKRTREPVSTEQGSNGTENRISWQDGASRPSGLADTSGERCHGERLQLQQGRSFDSGHEVTGSGEDGHRLADAEQLGWGPRRPADAGEAAISWPSSMPAGRSSCAEGLGNASISGARWNGRASPAAQAQGEGERFEPRGVGNTFGAPSAARPSGLEHTESFGLFRGQDSEDGRWRQRASGLASEDCPQWNGPTILVECKDGFRRIPAEPSLFPLADGVSKRVGKLRAAGNAINPVLALEFIKAAWECRP